MFTKLLDISILASNYRDNEFTYEITTNAADVPKLLSIQGLDHKPIQFMDEKVKIHEPVTVFLKSEKELLNDGWVPHGKSSLVLKTGKNFLIGKEKRKLLGTKVIGKIGITRDLTPFFFDVNNHWRFGQSEIKLILKQLPIVGEDKISELKSGTYQYKSKTNQLFLPSGRTIDGIQLNDLRLFLKECNLI